MGEQLKDDQKRVQLDPNLYGYSKEQLIEVTGNMLLYIAAFAERVAKDETSIVFDTTQIQEGDGPARNKNLSEIKSTVRETMTDKGLTAMEIYSMIMALHMNNVEFGIAKHQSVLFEENSKPTFEVEKADVQ